MFLQLVDILDYLHSLSPPVIHRDINPKNIILRQFPSQEGLTRVGLSPLLPERERQFPSWEGLGVGKKASCKNTNSEPTPDPSQEGNLAASPRKNLPLKTQERSGVGSVYLVDFGAVQEKILTTFLGGSTIVGTFGYIPFEQFSGHTVPASDYYALGATLLYMLTQLSGRLGTFRSSNLQGRQYQHLIITP